jgi:DNA-binding protein HU-beta
MSDKITFKELVEKISAKTEQSEQSTNDFIHELAEIIEASLGAGEKISIAGFGKFELRWMNERKGRNPQTGDEITIPGQNKVVFKPYKALRQGVNKPFENLESQIIGDEPENRQAESDSPLDSNAASSISKAGATSQPVSQTETTVEDLIIERESPVKSGSRILLNKLAVKAPTSDKRPADADDDLTSVFDQNLSRQENIAREVQQNRNIRWSYTAAAVIVMLSIFLLVFIWNQPEPPREQNVSSIAEQPGITQVDDTQETERTNQRIEDNEQVQNTGNDNAVPPSMEESETITNSDGDLISHTVSAGESLWTIAQTQYSNPYLWPLIYKANQIDLDSPNLLSTGNDLKIPALDNPEKLTQSEREKVALGYISVYDWILNNQPENARYFLWAAGSFSQEVLRDASENVNEADLAFATKG